MSKAVAAYRCSRLASRGSFVLQAANRIGVESVRGFASPSPDEFCRLKEVRWAKKSFVRASFDH